MANVNIKTVITAEDRASRVISGVGGKMTSLGKTMTRRVTLPVVAGFGLAIKSAMDFESSFAGVRKTVDATESEFEDLQKRFREMAKTTPINVNEINRIAELAGQLGVSGVDNLEKFTKTVADLSVTTNLTSEAAATDLARIANVMNLDVGKSIDRMGSSIVDLGNNFATTEQEISRFANRIAGAGKIAGLTVADVMGISAAFSSVGVHAERGGTAVSKTLFQMTRAVENGGEKLQQFADVAGVTTEQFAQAFEKDAAKAFDLFVQGLSKNGIKATSLLEELELSDQRLMQAFVSVAGAGGIMSKAIDTSSKAFEENNALVTEANKRYGTTESKVQIAKNQLNDLGITIGNQLLPVLASIVKDVAKVVDWFAKLDEGTQKIIIVSLAGAAAIGPLLRIFGGLATVIVKTIKAVKLIPSVMRGAWSSIKFTGRVMKTTGGIFKTAGKTALSGLKNVASFAKRGFVNGLSLGRSALEKLGNSAIVTKSPITNLKNAMNRLKDCAKTSFKTGIDIGRSAITGLRDRIKNIPSAVVNAKDNLLKLANFAKEGFVSGIKIGARAIGGLIKKMGRGPGNLLNAIKTALTKLKGLRDFMANNAAWRGAAAIGVVAAAIWAAGQIKKAFEAGSEARRAVDNMNKALANTETASQNAIDQVQKAVEEGRASQGQLDRLNESLRQGQQEIEKSRGSVFSFREILKDAIPGLAAGGDFSSGEPVIVGEKGPELIVPKTDGTVIPNHQIRKSRGNNISLNVNIGMFAGTAVERRKLAETIFKDLERLASKKGQTVSQLMGM